MMKITLNFETKEKYDDNRMQNFLESYFSTLDCLYRIINSDAIDHGITYLAQISTDMPLQDIVILIRDVKTLCRIMRQSSIACIITNYNDGIIDYSAKTIIGIDAGAVGYMPYNDKYFINFDNLKNYKYKIIKDRVTE